MNDAMHSAEEVSDLSPSVRESPAGNRADTASNPSLRRLAVAATFTAEPLQSPLTFWLHTLALGAEVVIAPYAQVLQQLLDPQSVLGTNNAGFNLVLVRMEDWIRDRWQQSIADNIQHIASVADEFCAAVAGIGSRTRVATLVFLCPTSTALPVQYHLALDEIQRQLLARLTALPLVSCWTHADLMRLYAVDRYEDPLADRIGHIPYTTPYFAAIATLAARRIAAFVKSPYKVIAVDCDNTLWKGVCGEDGATGIQLTSLHRKFQELLVAQHDAGMLLCLCSKNNPADVEAVFQAHFDMPLRVEHLICSRVNWESKSANLQSLSEELGLSLDSFILVDDSTMECAEVKAQCPAVLVLQLPHEEAEFDHFMRHVWAFDKVGVTPEARRRTRQYKENLARSKAITTSGDLAQFLASLQLEVTVGPMESAHVPRVAELTQRTNQFNLTTTRYSITEVHALRDANETQIHVVHVRDRFGDYGLVGTIFCRRDGEVLDVNTFLLSCRVLGRGVEHAVMNELGRMACQAGLSKVTLRYRKTARNAPAWKFLAESFGAFRVPADPTEQFPDEALFSVPAEYAQALMASAVQAPDAQPIVGLTSVGASASQATWHEIAYRLARIPDLLAELNRSPVKVRCATHPYVAPRTATELAIAHIWAEVLRLDRVGAHDDFFQLGGDSLVAVQALSRIASTLQRELALHDFFANPTVEAVANQLAVAREASEPIKRDLSAAAAPLSSAQRRLWFIDQLEGGSTAYHILLAVRLDGPLDFSALQAALDALVERHEALRTRFVTHACEPVQEVVPAGAFELQRIDLRAYDGPEQGVHVLRQSQEEVCAPFDLRHGPLMRGRLLQLADTRHTLLLTMHHIASDGWSIGIVISELGALYDAFREGKPQGLPALPIQYADYARWHVLWQKSAEVQSQLAYWHEHLRGSPELLELPTDRSRPAVQSHRGASVRITIEADLVASLRAFCSEHRATLAMVLYAGWSILLSRLARQDDIVIGVPVANRRRTELEELVGLFVNTLAVRLQFAANPSVREIVQRAKRTMLGAYAHQDVPFDQVVEALQPTRSLSQSPLFQVAFVLQNAPRSRLQLGGLTLVEEEMPTHTAQFDLSLSLQECADEIRGTLNYATDLFDESTVQRWAAYFSTVLRGMVRDPDMEVARLPLMGEAERQQVLHAFNATQTIYPSDKAAHELFEGQVRRTPDAVAAICEGQVLTYAELNSRANKMARHLQHQGLQCGEFVPIVMSRSMLMLVAQLATLKIGCAYVPMDRDVPAERQAFMIRDCGARVVLADQPVPADLLPPAVYWMDVSRLENALAPLSADDPCLSVAPNSAAYVMYTSGSTGVPKGVIVPHYAVTRLAINNGYAQIDGADCLVHYSNPAFDASTFEIWGALLTGARVLVVAQEVVFDSRRFAELLQQHSVTILYLSVGLFNQYSEALREVFVRLRYLMVGGDALEPGAIRRVLRGAAPQNLLNAYGPTECTTFSTTYPITSVADDAKSVPIGRPIANAQIYILDHCRQPVPIGVTGEIYIGGAGVATGYLNRPELTAERFIADPFNVHPEARMYRSGDLGRWRPDGVIEYLGRNDQQVKIRGFRIELGEIEAQLLRHSGVRDAVVSAREDRPGEKRLVAYIVPKTQAAQPTVDALRTHLKAVLPDYMLPSAFVTLEGLPITVNGKLDRRALPAPHLSAYANRTYEPPHGEIEELLAQIWRAVLQLDRVGRDDNFFDLGGHSLLGMQMVARVESLLSVDVPVRVLFEYPTIEQLAARIEDLRRERLLARAEIGDHEVEDLLNTVATMPPSQVRQLLTELVMRDTP